MSRYYCPFCSPRYQFHKFDSDGVLICGLCGDPLFKKPLLNLRRIIGVFVASAFLAPSLIMIFLVIKDFTDKKLPNKSEMLALSNIYLSWEK